MSGFEVPIEFHRLRSKDFRVVVTLNKKDGRRVRDNEMGWAGEKQIPAINRAKDLLNVGGREPRCSLSEVRGAKQVCSGTQVARFRRIRPDIEFRMGTGESGEGNELPSDAGTESEYLGSVQVVPRRLGSQIPDRALDILDLRGIARIGRKTIVHAGDGIARRSQCVKEYRVEVQLVTGSHTSAVDVHYDRTRATDVGMGNVEIQRL